MDNNALISKFEGIIERLNNKYSKELPEGYFFTEKEIHSYFYHLCLSEEVFKYDGYNLIHAEYPTPFKCSFANKNSDIIKEIDSEYMRAHIDLVLLNPNFVDWIKKEALPVGYEPFDYIKGVKNKRYSESHVSKL